MYVGPWQEYRLMKVVESLREKNERLQCELCGSGHSVASTRSISAAGSEQRSSRHFPTALDVAPPRVLLKKPLPTKSSAAPSAFPACRKPKRLPTVLRFVSQIQDVKVFVEEKPSENTSSTVRDTASIDVPSSCSNGSMKCGKKIGRRNDAGRLSTSRRGGAQNAITTTPVHVELGTGMVVRDHQVCPSYQPEIDDRDTCLASLAKLGQSKVLQEDHFLKLLCEGPLDTKKKYQMAGQPLPVPQRLKKLTKGEATSDEEIQKQIERRLRLQMLYSNNEAVAEQLFTDSLHAVGGGEGLGEKEEKKQPPQQNAIESLTNAGRPVASVPWDIFPLERQHPLTARDSRADVSSMGFSGFTGERGGGEECTPSPQERHHRLTHPYDVGEPLRQSAQQSTSSPADMRNTPNMQNYPREERCGESGLSNIDEYLRRLSGQHASSADAEFRQESLLTATAPYHPGSFGGNGNVPMVNSPFVDSTSGFVDVPKITVGDDDDNVGALISWAELLDPDSIV